MHDTHACIASPFPLLPPRQDSKPTRVIDLRQCMPVKPEFAQLDNGEVQRCIYIPSPIRTFILYVPDDSEHYRWLAAIEASRLQSRASKAGWLVKQGERVKVRPRRRSPPGRSWVCLHVR